MSIVSEHGKRPAACTACLAAGREHQIVEIPAGVTDRWSDWGPGVAQHKRHCTGCGLEDGPWVKESDVQAGL